MFLEPRASGTGGGRWAVAGISQGHCAKRLRRRMRGARGVPEDDAGGPWARCCRAVPCESECGNSECNSGPNAIGLVTKDRVSPRAHREQRLVRKRKIARIDT